MSACNRNRSFALTVAAALAVMVGAVLATVPAPRRVGIVAPLATEPSAQLPIPDRADAALTSGTSSVAVLPSGSTPSAFSSERALWFGQPGGPPATPRTGEPGGIVRALLDEHRSELGLDRMDGELAEVREFDSISGHHLRLRQVYRGVEVEGSEVSAHVTSDGRPLLLAAEVFAVAGVPTTPEIPAADALAIARSVLMDEGNDDASDDASDDSVAGTGASPDFDDSEIAAVNVSEFEAKAPVLVLLPVGKGARLAWRVDVRTPLQSTRLWIDAGPVSSVAGESSDGASTAGGGTILRTRDLRRAADGTALVFDPNPVYSARNQTLRDRDDKDTNPLTAELKLVTLERLDGSGALRGLYADATRTRGHVARANLDFTGTTRSQDLFEAVMCYYHVDTLQARLQALGLRGVNERRQVIDGHALSADQSFYDDFDRSLNMGDGGVDDAEDADVIHHEYGHAIQDDQVPGFGDNSEGRAMGEGFSDFLAVSLRSSGDDRYDAAVASWDATSYSKRNPPALRRVDENKRYPRDIVGEVHTDGELWSRFLWDLAHLVGFDDALRLVVGSHDLLSANARFQQGASAVLAANISVRGGRDDFEIRGLLTDRGFPFTTPPRPKPTTDEYEENDTAGAAKPIVPGDYDQLLLADDDWYSVLAQPYRRNRVTATFDPGQADIDLMATTASGAFLAQSATSGASETLEVASSVDAATFLFHVSASTFASGGSGYRFIISDLGLESLAIGPAVVRNAAPEGTYATQIAVPEEKVGRRLVVTTSRTRRNGAVTDLRIVSPAGVEVDFGDGRKPVGARAVVTLSEPGIWIVEVRPRQTTSGAFKLRARLRSK